MADQVNGKVAIVTGAASGIGREVALLLAKEGAKVVVSDVSEAASFVTGAAMLVDGGYTAQ